MVDPTEDTFDPDLEIGLIPCTRESVDVADRASSSSSSSSVVSDVTAPSLTSTYPPPSPWVGCSGSTSRGDVAVIVPDLLLVTSTGDVTTSEPADTDTFLLLSPSAASPPRIGSAFPTPSASSFSGVRGDVDDDSAGPTTDPCDCARAISPSSTPLAPLNGSGTSTSGVCGLDNPRPPEAAVPYEAVDAAEALCNGRGFV
jgi:hypothetical protein